MTERRPIFSTTGDQIGYTEGDAAFDLFDRQRCIYNAATGNLSDFTTESLLAMYRLRTISLCRRGLRPSYLGQPCEADADLSNMVELPSPSSEDSQPAAADGSGAPGGAAAAAYSEVFDGNPPETGFDTSSDPHAPDPTEFPPSQRMILNYWSAR